MDSALKLAHSNHLPGSLGRFILAAFVLIFALAGCQVEENDLPSSGPPEASLTPTFIGLGDWYTVYFTNPQDPTSKSYRGGPDQDLAEAIRRARLSVDIAVLQLNLWSVRDALLEAHRSGVRVRMVTESDYLDEREVQQLIEAGVPVIGDRGEGLMHNKFVVIDRLEVWTGSMNFTVSEGYRNNNTLIRLRSPELAENYSLEFEEMFTDDHFGRGSPADTPHPELTISGTPVQSCFGPEDGCTERLVRLISAAEQEIVFLAFSFTSDELAAALIERFSRGVSVRGVMEASQVDNRGTDLERMLAAGLDVRLDGNPNQMHAKVMVIDGRVVGMGSFNFTYSAETRNDENLLIIDDARIAEAYMVEFQRIFNQAQAIE